MPARTRRRRWTTMRKAILGTLAAGLGSLAVALTDDQVSAAELVAALSTAVAAAGLVYGVPNDAGAGR